MTTSVTLVQVFIDQHCTIESESAASVLYLYGAFDMWIKLQCDSDIDKLEYNEFKIILSQLGYSWLGGSGGDSVYNLTLNK